MCRTSVDPMPSRMSIAEPQAKAFEDRGRQRLAGRDGAPDAREIRFAPFLAMRQQHRVVRRHREEQRRTVALDEAVDDGRRHRAGPENRRRADRQREVHGVAEAVGEEELRDAEAPIREVRCRRMPCA